MALLARQSRTVTSLRDQKSFQTAPVQRSVRCRSYVPVELIAAAGDVDAPVTVPIVAALVVTAVVTFAVPAYLNRGQEAADKIFASKQKRPLDAGKKGGKTTGKRR